METHSGRENDASHHASCQVRLQQRTRVKGKAVIRFLRNEDVVGLLTMSEVIDVLREMYEEVGRDVSVGTPRCDVHHPMSQTDVDDTSEGFVGRAHYLKTMVGGFVGGGLVALRLSSDVVRFSVQNDLLRREKQPIVPGKWFGMVALFGLDTGELKALVQDGVVQRMRVGATSAIGDDHLARHDIATVGVLGSGGQARAHLEAFAHVRDFAEARVWSPNPSHREVFCTEMSEKLQRCVVPAGSAAAAVDGVDVLMTATNSREPFVDAAWLQPGIHVSTLHRDEVSDAGYDRVDRIVLHTHAKEVTVSSAKLPRWRGALLQDHPVSSALDWSAHPTIAEVVAGRALGRQDAAEITAFVNNLGLGSQFAAVGSIILAKAEKAGIGILIDSETVFQGMHS